MAIAKSTPGVWIGTRGEAVEHLLEGAFGGR
jgi:hypothetical protein